MIHTHRVQIPPAQLPDISPDLTSILFMPWAASARSVSSGRLYRSIRSLAPLFGFGDVFLRSDDDDVGSALDIGGELAAGGGGDHGLADPGGHVNGAEGANCLAKNLVTVALSLAWPRRLRRRKGGDLR